MGGNALKHVGVERKLKADYDVVMTDVMTKLAELFPASRCGVPLSYSDKESFGDGDVLLESNWLPADWKEKIKEVFQPTDTVSNGGVFSFDYQKMQIDIITSPKEDFAINLTYLSYNDLGNLMGRVAHKMGFKYGHDGLTKVMRDGSEKVGEVPLSKNAKEIFHFLGYDYNRFCMGFQKLEHIFEFAASSPYFSRTIYQLENRNNVSRVRDAKRPTYTAFLKWLEEKSWLDKYHWSPYVGDNVSTERDAERTYWNETAFKFFPHFKTEYDYRWSQHLLNLRAKLKWNGEIVSNLTGLKGKELGAFMKFCKDNPPGHPVATLSFNQLMDTLSNEQIAGYTAVCLITFKRQEIG